MLMQRIQTHSDNGKFVFLSRGGSIIQYMALYSTLYDKCNIYINRHEILETVIRYKAKP